MRIRTSFVAHDHLAFTDTEFTVAAVWALWCASTHSHAFRSSSCGHDNVVTVVQTLNAPCDSRSRCYIVVLASS